MGIAKGRKIGKTSVSMYTEIPQPVGIVEQFKLASYEGFGLVGFAETVQVNPVIVTEIIEVADREEMEFNAYFVKTESVFEFETSFEFNSQEYPIDSGRMTKLVTDTEQYARIDSFEVVQSG